MIDAYPVGTVFKRRVPKNDSLDEVRVVGGGNALIVTSNTEFGPPMQIPLADLFAEFVDQTGADLQEPETDGRRMSPTEVFEKETRDQKQREALAGDPPTKGRGRAATKPTN